jgi:hypothetical protein
LHCSVNDEDCKECLSVSDEDTCVNRKCGVVAWFNSGYLNDIRRFI